MRKDNNTEPPAAAKFSYSQGEWIQCVSNNRATLTWHHWFSAVHDLRELFLHASTCVSQKKPMLSLTKIRHAAMKQVIGKMVALRIPKYVSQHIGNTARKESAIRLRRNRRFQRANSARCWELKMLASAQSVYRTTTALRVQPFAAPGDEIPTEAAIHKFCCGATL